MGNKKRYINNEAELLSAMRSTGYCFPMNGFEQKLSLKALGDPNLEELAEEINPEEIWDAIAPKKYKLSSRNTSKVIEDDFSKEWGIAAKGNANISKEIMDKIRKNQEKNNK